MVAQSTSRNIVGRVTVKLATPGDITVIMCRLYWVSCVYPTCVELHLAGRVSEGVARDEHLAVHVLGALADVGRQREHEAEHVEAQFVGGAERQSAHHRHQAQLHVQTRHLA